jgi:hypothetical protein
MAGSVKSLARSLPMSWQDRARRLSRLRWIEKWRLIEARPTDRPVSLRTRLGYVLFSPEVGDYTYELANEDELVALLADAIGHPVEELAAYAAETKGNARLEAALSRRVHKRWDMKRRVSFGRNMGWYVLVRALKPRLVVETGIKHGVGSLALLLALERNAADGDEGRLISFDIDPASGWIVPEDLRSRWTIVLEPTEEGLEPVLEREGPADIFVHDTPPDYDREVTELDIALPRMRAPWVILSGNGANTPALPELAEKHGLRYLHFQPRAADHWYDSLGLGVAVPGRVPGS